MDLATALEDIKVLSVDERLRLVDAIWESIAAQPHAFPVTEAQKRELERRAAAHAANPSEVVPWETVRAEALARARR